MPPPQTVIALSTSSSSSSSSPKPSSDAATRTSTGGDPATLLQYSAKYGNPYLRPTSAQWPAQPPRQKYDAYGRPEPPPYSAVGKGKRKTAAAGPSAAAVPAGPNYHIGMAKRQTLATHV